MDFYSASSIGDCDFSEVIDFFFPSIIFQVFYTSTYYFQKWFLFLN